MTATPRFLVIEGIDGCGKSTQVERLAGRHGWLATREPGGTALGGAILFSPVFGVLPPTDLSAWILADRLPVRLQLQVHKYIWGAHARGV